MESDFEAERAAPAHVWISSLYKTLAALQSGGEAGRGTHEYEPDRQCPVLAVQRHLWQIARGYLAQVFSLCIWWLEDLSTTSRVYVRMNCRVLLCELPH